MKRNYSAISVGKIAWALLAFNKFHVVLYPGTVGQDWRPKNAEQALVNSLEMNWSIKTKGKENDSQDHD